MRRTYAGIKSRPKAPPGCARSEIPATPECSSNATHWRRNGKARATRVGVYVRFQVDSGSDGLGAPRPVVLVASADHARAQGEDAVDADDGPVHPGLLAALPDDRLAAHLDDPGSAAQALPAELVVAHAHAVSFEIAQPQTERLGLLRAPAQALQHDVEAAQLGWVATGLRPLRGRK